MDVKSVAEKMEEPLMKTGKLGGKFVLDNFIVHVEFDI